jgi:hypothetical protein
MTDVRYGGRAWEPGARQIARLLAAVADPDLDSETLYFLSFTFGNLRTPQAVAPLLRRLPNSAPTTRRGIVHALGAIGVPKAIGALHTCLRDGDERVRRQAVAELAGTCQDKIDRELLMSQRGFELDARLGHEWHSGLDPQSPITAKRIAEAAKKLKRPNIEIRQRYKRLAEEFNLKLRIPGHRSEN